MAGHQHSLAQDVAFVHCIAARPDCPGIQQERVDNSGKVLHQSWIVWDIIEIYLIQVFSFPWMNPRDVWYANPFNNIDIFIGPRCPWGPIYGSGCLSLSELPCTDLTDVTEWWRYQLNTNW